MSATSSYSSGPCELPLLGEMIGVTGRGLGGHRPGFDLEPMMGQAGDEGIRERLAGVVFRLRPGRGHRPSVLPNQPEPRNEEERA